MSVTRVKQNFHTPEYAQKKRELLIRRIVVGVSAVVILLGASIGVSYIPAIRIQTIRVEGAHILSAEDIRATAHKLITGRYAFVFPKNNAALYPHDELVRSLQQEYPRIQTIQVGLENPQTLSITVTERQPFALWCNNIETVSQCYFLDRSGFVFSPAPDFSGDAYFKYFGLVPYESPVGSSYLSSSEKFTELSDFVARVKALQITPLYLVATSQDDFELHLYGGGTLIFDDHESMAETGERLAKLLTTAHLVPQKNGELLVEYVDLRFGNKLYYKVRGAPTP